MYCTYLTVYYGNKLPSRYIGSSTVTKVLNGYNGSVKSIKWKTIYDEEQRNNKNLFKTRILETFNTSLEARISERLLQLKYNVVTSDKYFNESIAAPNGFFGRDVSGKNNPMFGRVRKGETHANGDNISMGLKKMYNTEKGNELKEASSLRLTLNNPSSNKDIVEKNKELWASTGRNIGTKNGMFGKEGKSKGKKLYNNGILVKAFYEYEVPFGWSKGRIKKAIAIDTTLDDFT